MENNRNFFITIALSIAILTLWQVFYMNPKIEGEREAARIAAERSEAEQKAARPGVVGDADLPSAPQQPGEVPGTDGVSAVSREAALAATRRIRVDTPSLSGSINLTGARIDDVRLKHYHLTVDDQSPTIELMNPAQVPNAQYAEIGYVGDASAGTLPGPSTVWTVAGDPVLTPATPVTLTYETGSGLTFNRTISVDANYMFTVTDSIANSGAAAATLYNYGRVMRFQKPTHASIYVLHEGLIGVTGEEGLQEIDYSTLEEDKQIKPGKSSNGWLGVTDKYWAAALVPSTAQPFQPGYAYFDDNNRPRYRADFITDAVVVQPGQPSTIKTMVFTGAKEVAKIQAYETDQQIRQFDLLIDWGWFYFITKPMFHMIDWLYRLLGNFGLAILATTVVVKAVFFPLASKSYKSMARMKMVQPKLLEIREKYADDKMKQQQAMMELYKTEKINPIAGCWPVLIQIPVFFALYKVLYVTIEMRHAPFFGWIQDLAAPDPTSLFNLFGLLPYDPGAIPIFGTFLMLGVWPLVMGVTMFLQMRMNPAPPDPTQQMIFNWMPVLFTFMLASFPAGLVIYWAWNNTLSIMQQGLIMKQQGARIELWDNLASLWKRKPDPAE